MLKVLHAPFHSACAFVEGFSNPIQKFLVTFEPGGYIRLQHVDEHLDPPLFYKDQGGNLQTPYKTGQDRIT